MGRKKKKEKVNWLGEVKRCPHTDHNRGGVARCNHYKRIQTRQQQVMFMTDKIQDIFTHLQRAESHYRGRRS